MSVIELPKILDDRGNLSFFESNAQIPFQIKRVYWIYDVPGGEVRGGHAFIHQQEFITVLSGSIDIILKQKNGEEKKISLNRSYNGLFIPRGIWRHMENFSTNAFVLVVSDKSYDENDYIRDWEKYANE